MNKNTEQAKALVEQGKGAALSAYKKGNEMMDKVSFLKSPTRKKVAWGIVGVIVLSLFLRICGCGGSLTPFEVAQETMVALVAGDMETLFENMYLAEEITKLPDAQKALLAEELIKHFTDLYASLSDAERAVIIEGLSNMKHVSTEIDGDTAVVTATMKNADGDDNSQVYTLHKVDGDWRLELK